MVPKRLVLDQIPILWMVKCSGEREEMDFLFEPLISTLLSGGMGLVSLFFSLLLLQFFLRKMTHTSIMIEFLVGSIA